MTIIIIKISKIKNESLYSLIKVLLDVKLQHCYRLDDLLDAILHKLEVNSYECKETVNDFSWFIPLSQEKLPTNVNKMYLLIIKEIYFLKQFYQNNKYFNEIIHDRGLFKQNVMTLPYGSTPYGRKEQIKEFIKSFNIKKV